jgi:hypothetical protein
MLRWLGASHCASLGSIVLACGGSAGPRAEHAQGAERPQKAEPRPELPPLEVVATLRGNETELRRCFFANPGSRGFVLFSWDVDEAGLVHAVKKELSTIGDRRVEGCLAERLGELKFGELDGPKRGRWAFVFQLVHNPEAAPARERRKGKGRGQRTKVREKPLHPDDEAGVTIEPGSQGRLELDAVDRTIERGYPLFARCYRDGVLRNNDMAGAIRLRFVVSRDGSLESIADAGSDLSDRQVVDCVAEAFFSLRFPEPQKGPASVLYRIHFAAR